MMQIQAVTDIGLVRRQNQDAFGHMQQGDQSIAVVCDGMGGSKGGEVASKLAVDTFLNTVCASLRSDMSPEQVREVASYAISVANSAIRAESDRNEEYAGMGTTLVSAITCQDSVVISNVGDSRAYLIKDGEIQRISRDHSLVETLVERGDITEDEARVHPKRNFITRALGPEAKIQSDGYIVDAQKGAYILLCTDGLVSTVTDQEMLCCIRAHENDADAALAAMLDIAKSNGAPDNVTALLAKIL